MQITQFETTMTSDGALTETIDHCDVTPDTRPEDLPRELRALIQWSDCESCFEYRDANTLLYIDSEGIAVCDACATTFPDDEE